MTKLHRRLSNAQSQNSEITPKPLSMPTDLDGVELKQRHYVKPAVKEWQEEAAQALPPSREHSSDTSKWPKGLVTAGVIAANLILWAVLVGVIRQFI